MRSTTDYVNEKRAQTANTLNQATDYVADTIRDAGQTQRTAAE